MAGKTNMVQTYVWLTPQIRKWLEEQKAKTGRGLSELVREALAKEMGQPDGGKA